MSYQETLAYLFSLERLGMVFGLESITRLLQLVDDPHKRLQTIHVGGTNGKGSVCAFISSVLQKGGYKVGLYTSPHLVSFTERIQINGKEIAWDEVARLTELLRSRGEEEGVPQQFSFFDFTTALAFYYLALQQVDVAVIEVGLGGRLDSTNVLLPLITVITNVTREHADILGNTVQEIAREKAGIVKPGVPVISGVTQPEVIPIIEEECGKKGAPLRLVSRDFSAERIEPKTMDFHGQRCQWQKVRVKLSGSHQIYNAALALSALEVLREQGWNVTEKSIYAGLAEANCPGRLELMQDAPGVLLDGAHNPAAARALRRALQEEFEYRRLFMLVGILEDKDAQTMLAELAPMADSLVAVKPDTSRAMAPNRIAEIARRYCEEIQIIEDVAKALEQVLKSAQKDDLILATGSLYTVGEARKHLMNTQRR